MRQRLVFVIEVIVAILAVLALVFISTSRTPSSLRQPNATITPEIITKEGEIICLPHKDTSGPQTQECALGLKTSSGSYYSLRDDRQPPPLYQTGELLRVTGQFTARTNSIYQDVGVIVVSSVIKL